MVPNRNKKKKGFRALSFCWPYALKLNFESLSYLQVWRHFFPLRFEPESLRLAAGGSGMSGWGLALFVSHFNPFKLSQFCTLLKLNIIILNLSLLSLVYSILATTLDHRRILSWISARLSSNSFELCILIQKSGTSRNLPEVSQTVHNLDFLALFRKGRHFSFRIHSSFPLPIACDNHFHLLCLFDERFPLVWSWKLDFGDWTFTRATNKRVRGALT